MDSLTFQKEISELRKEVEGLKSDLTVALTKIGDKLATQTQNFLELRSKLDRLNNVYTVEGEQADNYGFAEVQDEHSNRDSTTGSFD